jgi:RecB family exonuclease
LTLTTLHTLWRTNFISQGYASRPEMDARLMEGERVLNHFFEWWKSSPRTVLGIETAFKISLHHAAGNVDTLSGRIDRIEQMQSGIRIVDFKTSQPQTQLQADNDLQLSIYSIAAHEKWGDREQELILLFLDEDGVTERKTVRSPGQRKDAMTAIRGLEERIGSDDFRPTPSAGTCRNCPFRFICGARAV